MENMTLTYLGHACFLLDFNGYRVVTDPYADDSVPGLAPVRVEAEAVYCTHGHKDHSAAENVTLTGKAAPADFSVETLETEHDDHGGALRGQNRILIFNCGGLRCAHMGDLGRPLTETETAKLQDLDLLLIPVGGFFTIDAAQAKAIIDALRPRVTVPMHYRTKKSGYPVIARIEKALKTLGPATQAGDTLSLDEASGLTLMEQRQVTI